MTLADCTLGDLVELADGERVSLSFRQPIKGPAEAVFVRFLDPIDGTRSDPRPLPASTAVVEVVEAAARGDDAGDERAPDLADPLLRGVPRRPGEMFPAGGKAA